MKIWPKTQVEFKLELKAPKAFCSIQSSVHLNNINVGYHWPSSKWPSEDSLVINLKPTPSTDEGLASLNEQRKNVN